MKSSIPGNVFFCIGRADKGRVVPTFGDLMLRICWFTYHTHTHPKLTCNLKMRFSKKESLLPRGSPFSGSMVVFLGVESIYEFHHIFLLKKLIRIWKDFRVGSSSFTQREFWKSPVEQGCFSGSSVDGS